MINQLKSIENVKFSSCFDLDKEKKFICEKLGDSGDKKNFDNIVRKISNNYLPPNSRGVSYYNKS